ncbi:ABC transporter substrate-binding protein [Shewanella sp. VB17]|nr:ABC transporter substrate-binding protein [Shewanella sp. VB17]
MSELRLLTEQWVPVSYEKNGVNTGFAVELVNQLQIIIGSEQKVEVLPWARAMSIANSTPNVMLFATSINKARRKSFDFVGPIITSNISLYAKANDNIELNDVSQLKTAGHIGAYRGSIGASMLKELGLDQLLISSFPTQSAKQLLRGRIRLWCQADIAVNSLLDEIGSNLDAIKPVLVISEISLYLAFSKGTQLSVIETWDNALTEYKRSGKFRRLYFLWFGELPVPETAKLIRREK